MTDHSFSTALIVGAGSGISASLARLFAKNGLKVALAARDAGKLAALAEEVGGSTFAADASDPAQVKGLFDAVGQAFGDPGLVVYNASARARGRIVDLDPVEVANALTVSAYGGFLVGQEATRRMLKRSGSPKGVILFTGASASVKGYPLSAPFAMGKFALRGLAQSMARELAPQDIHVAHFVIDGGVASAKRVAAPDRPDSLLSPDSIAETYWQIAQQKRNAWTWEVELRPWVEPF